MNIILLEPDKVLADTYRQALMGQGHKVTMCASAQAAIFAADEHKPDVVIVELQLVGHSGIEFLYEFRSYDDWQKVPALILTNVPAGEFSGSWDLLKNELNVSAYHYKPLTSLQALFRSVESAAATAVA
jgi:CheY-like chemotaxis protein